MQIDFHHTVTYVLARLAGFSAKEAQTIGHSAQYVDDATNAGEIMFTNGAQYQRIASAHKMLDYKNFQALANARVWVPFHFLPGNGGRGPGVDPDGEFIRKLVCSPDSYVARQMVSKCIEAHDSPYALHRLGISMHVYADTWAHQGFAGVSHKINIVTDLRDHEGEQDLGIVDRLRVFFGDAFESLSNELADCLPLGHGAALTHPDMPFLRWSYTNGLGERIERDNLADYTTAVQRIFDRLVEFRDARRERNIPTSLSQADLKQIVDNFKAFTDRDGDERHRRWCESIAKGDFSFGEEEVAYIAKGEGSWKHSALDDTDDRQQGNDGFTYRASFLKSDWKLFHDALQMHRLTVLQEVLPLYAICAA